MHFEVVLTEVAMTSHAAGGLGPEPLGAKPKGDRATVRPGRDAWIDQARGLGIALVVWGHAWRGVHEAGLLPSETLFAVVDRLVYAVHMPLFFLLSGLLLERALLGASMGAFTWSRVVRLLYPLVLWTYLFAAFKAAAGSLANDPVGWSELLVAPLPPRWHLWFLWALFLIQIACLPLAPFLRGARRPGAIWAAILAASLLPFAPIGTSVVAGLLAPAVFHAPFVILGAALARTFMALRDTAARTMSLIAVTGGTIFVAAEVLAFAGPETTAVNLLVGAAGAVALCILALWATARRPATEATPLAALGRAAMPVFLSHTIFSAVARIVLLRAGVEAWPVHLLLGVAAGLLGPLLLVAAARRAGMMRVLGF